VTRHPEDEPRLLRHAAERALLLGRSVAGTTAQNPPVGCVIVADGAIVGEGATRPIGEDHAEIVALRDAGDRARGATAVVTLEPCAHVGRTPACTDALQRAGIRRVRHLVADPNPLAAGGTSALRAAGIDASSVVTVVPELADLAVRAEHDLRGFLTFVRDGRPHVLLKMAQLADGRTSDADSAERYLTGTAARHRVHELRADVDAVLVGSGTVIADDPHLDVRDVPVARQPRPVVLATTGVLPSAAEVLRRRALVLVGDATPAVVISTLESAGAEVHRVPTLVAEGVERIDVGAALRMLAALGVLRVLAEPGLTLARALLGADLVDVVELHVAASVPGDPIVAALALDRERFETVDVRPFGDDLVVIERQRGRAAHHSAPEWAVA
jgi:diaminohydroxyphosphoribosylaminopyrimidine deaminase / 5-amino-6-(5-phosphoribosylamino)uracil reductase